MIRLNSFVSLLIVLALGASGLWAADGPAFSVEFRRTEDRLVKVAVSSDRSGSSIRTLVLDVKSGSSAAAQPVRDQQRQLTADEADKLRELIAAVRPPALQREVIAEGSVWLFKNNNDPDGEVLIFRSPTFKPKERQLEAIRLLGEYVWRIENLRKDAGRLY